MSIGARLKEAREKRKISINRVYENTRIHPDMLYALEDDEYGKIPNSTYVKGFLRTYATYLGLDAEAVVEEYDKLKLQETREHQPVKLQNDISKKLEYIEVLKKYSLPALKWIIILILVVVASKGVFRLIKNRPVSKKPKVETTSVKNVVVAPLLKNIDIPKEEGLILRVEATDDVWLNLKVDGKLIFQNVLKKGTSETWKAEENFTIWTGNADALQMSLNESNIGSPGSGVVKDLIVDREGLRK